jgi:hypothetical protein
MRKWLFLSIVAVLGIYGCSDSSSTNTSGGLGPTGILQGQVSQLRDARFRQVQDKSGVLVQVEGTSFSAITDTGGNWEIKNLPTSTYSISFSKPGYLTIKNTSFQFVGGGIQVFTGIVLCQPLTFSCTLDFISLPSPSGPVEGFFYGHTSDNTPDSALINLYYIISRSPSIEIDNGSTISRSFYSDQVYASSATHDSSLSFKTLIYSGILQQFHSGDTVYVRVFPSLFTQTYYDVYAKKDVITGYGEGSNILSAIMP